MVYLQILAVVCMFSHMSWGHGGHHEGKPLEFASEIHNKDHILEHLQRQISTKPQDQMTDEELEFHYFKLHDYDNNNKLDGVEIGKALTHVHDDSSEESANKTQTDKTQTETPVKTDAVISESIELALKTFDRDGDGYIEYFEYKTNKKRVEK